MLSEFVQRSCLGCGLAPSRSCVDFVCHYWVESGKENSADEKEARVWG